VSTCRQCGKPVPIYKNDCTFPDGKVWHRTGARSGSTRMMSIDPNKYFCTLRCAAMFGVRAAARGFAK
jgi:hypothetical protein